LPSADKTTAGGEKHPLTVFPFFADLLFMKTILLALLLALPAQADWTNIKSSDFAIPPPPAEGSAAGEKDFEQLRAYQNQNRKTDCEISNRQFEPDFESLFGPDLTLLTAQEKAAAAEVAEKMMKLSERVAGYHKDKFKRPRPYDVDPMLKPCVRKPGGSKAYPSSHAANAAAGACVLALYYPQKARALIAYGDQLGEIRAIVGVHHPSDVVAGRNLGKEICRRAQSHPDFKQEIRR
jgi:acid phosphatase (class A)